MRGMATVCAREIPSTQVATLGSGSLGGGLARVTGMDGLLPYPSVASLKAARRHGWSSVY